MSDLLFQQALIEAKALLEDPGHWTSGAYARNLEGSSVDPLSPVAVCWCLEGAIRLKTEPLFATPPLELYDLLDAAATMLYSTQLRIDHVNFDTGAPEEPICPYFAFESANYANDTLGHSAALSILDKAIELLNKR